MKHIFKDQVECSSFIFITAKLAVRMYSSSQEARCSIFLDGEGALFKWLDLVNISLVITKNFTGPHVSVEGSG